jgi:hypothetical protein
LYFYNTVGYLLPGTVERLLGCRDVCLRTVSSLQVDIRNYWTFKNNYCDIRVSLPHTAYFRLATAPEPLSPVADLFSLACSAFCLIPLLDVSGHDHRKLGVCGLLIFDRRQAFMEEEEQAAMEILVQMEIHVQWKSLFNGNQLSCRSILDMLH